MSSRTVLETIDTALGKIEILRPLGKGKSGYSFLAEWQGQPVVFKRMHHEPCPYYTFSDNKVQLEVAAYEQLKAIGVTVPELLGFDAEQDYLVKAYCAGMAGHEWLAQGRQDEAIIAQLFAMAHRLRAQQLNIDYFPPNFVIVQEQLYYVDYEVNVYAPEWSLEEWGIYYWANCAGMAEYARSGDWRSINESADSGIPIKAPFEEQVRKWKMKFSDGSAALR